ncbi:hypothetical protein F4778DRAFT_178089 [Xylariomycetidae sp. FL2044]|nr:hypothetical protein F4778DRAFT_178089 [Xylariomycetidae sp. FL2044]
MPRSSSSRLSTLLPFSPTTTPLQATTYLLGISLFSISFLVFLNSALSFVITDLVGVKEGVGNIVGTLGFVDEIVALVACPLWGLLSDRLGVRWVAVLGYAVIGIALFGFVQARDVYPSLVLARIGFAIGATAAATMVTATLPGLTDDGNADGTRDDGGEGGHHGEGVYREEGENGLAGYSGDVDADADADTESNGNGRTNRHNPRDSIAMSLESDATITPERFTRTLSQQHRNRNGRGRGSDSYDYHDDDEEDETPADGRGRKPAALAGYVGLFTGCGALVALVLFLPLPAQFSKKEGVTPAQAITDSFYVVGTVALLVAVFVFFGLRGLKGEEGKGWRALFSSTLTTTNSHLSSSGANSTAAPRPPPPYHRLLLSALRLGATDPHIALGYLGGFVARASTVAISLFVPLYVNAFFISRGYCRGSPDDAAPDLKRECREAYVLASILTGVGQLAALLCAPVFGYYLSRGGIGGSSSSSKSRGSGVNRVNIGVTLAALLGLVGYAVFPSLASPEIRDVDGRGGSPAVFIVVIMLGISQIGAIVCSLASLGRGVLAPSSPSSPPAPLTTTTTFTTPSSSSSSYPPPSSPHSPHEHNREGRETEEEEEAQPTETQALLQNARRRRKSEEGGRFGGGILPPARGSSRVHLKGSIAGVYSWCGGLAILLLTKLGGYLFDVASPGAPFYMMAVFNGVLLVASLGLDLLGRGRERGEKQGWRTRTRARGRNGDGDGDDDGGDERVGVDEEDGGL